MIRETFNLEFITQLKGALESAPSSTSKMSKADVLRQLGPTLKTLREERGYTLEALTELLKANGLTVTVSTLQGAFPPANPAHTKSPARSSSRAVTGSLGDSGSRRILKVASANRSAERAVETEAVDRSLIDAMLRLTPEERLRQNDRMLRTIGDLRDAFAARRADDAPLNAGHQRR